MRGIIMSKQKRLFFIVCISVFLLIVLMVLIFSFSGKTSASLSGVNKYTADEYLTAMDQQQVTDWFETAGDKHDTAYVLRHIGTSDIGFQKAYAYAVYVPSAGKDSAVGLGSSGSLFNRYLKFNLDPDVQGEGAVFCITYFTDDDTDFRVYMDSSRISTEMTDVDFRLNPSV